jgi:hypothetical protein
VKRSRIIVMALAVVALVTLLPDTAAAAAPACKVIEARTSLERADLWRNALEDYALMHPGLTDAQRKFIDEARGLTGEIAALRQDERAQADFVRKATRVMEQARELFTKNELGELFTSMGQTQIWLAQIVGATPLCNCVGPGPCQAPNGGPKGDCGSGCVTWDDTGGTRWNGVCNAIVANPQ